MCAMHVRHGFICWCRDGFDIVSVANAGALHRAPREVFRMRNVRLGAVFGALCVLGSCVPVDDDPPVQGSKQIQQLSGHEIVALCDWTLDYMGGPQSNQEGVNLGEGIVHRCPGDIGIPTDEDGAQDLNYVRFVYDDCPPYLASKAQNGCTLTVNDYASWIEAVGETPCRHHYQSNDVCTLEWAPGDAP
jgi:hypothetical protein